MDYMWDLKRTYLWFVRDSKELITNLASNLKDVFKNTFYYLPRDIYRFVKRMIKIAPLMWNDCDYDHSAALRLFRYKIQQIRDHIAKHQLHDDWKRDVAQMDKALHLLDVNLDTNDAKHKHFEKLEAELDEKYGYSLWYTEDEVMNDKEKLKKAMPFGRSMFSKRTKENDKNRDEIHKADRKRIKNYIKWEAKQWTDLWKLISQNMQGWWD